MWSRVARCGEQQQRQQLLQLWTRASSMGMAALKNPTIQTEAPTHLDDVAATAAHCTHNVLSLAWRLHLLL